MKYFTLRALGVPADAMDIVVFRDPQSGERHAVLQVRQRGEALILDNRTDQFSRASAIGNPIVVLNDVSARFSGALFEARQNSLLQSQPRRGLWRRIINAVLS